MIICPMCKERGQDWLGDAPVCSFPKGLFSPVGWNCATANAIRDIVTVVQYIEDQHYATIPIGDVIVDERFYPGDMLWITWYKNRGRTDGMWLLEGNDLPRRPTIAECEAIVQYYEDLSND